jgi:hypothetical protein
MSRGGDDPEAAAARARSTAADGFDDVIIDGRPAAMLVERLLPLLRAGGAFAVRCGDPAPCEAAVDAGAVHYRGLWLTAASGDPPAYPWERTCELVGGGDALFIGAGGPLGQMHLQRALSLPLPPRRIVATQRGGPRLEELRARFEFRARERGIDWLLLDPIALGDTIYDRARAATGGRGFDDVVTIIPDLGTIEAAFRLLAPGGGLNLFAGVAVGSPVRLDLARVYAGGARLWGTSGSRISDLRRIVERVAGGQLSTDAIVAAVGGIEAVAEGLAAVRDARFPGKALIYPHLGGLPLTPVAALAERHPSIAARLSEGRLWSTAAEAELLRLYGS